MRGSDRPSPKDPTSSELHIQWRDAWVCVADDCLWFTNHHDRAKNTEWLREMLHEIPLPYSPLQEADYRYITTYPLTKPWDVVVFAHILTTHHEYRQRLAYSESQQPISAKVKKMIRIANTRVVVTMNIADPDLLSIRMSNLEKDQYDTIMALLNKVLIHYHNVYEEVFELYYHVPAMSSLTITERSPESYISYLRRMDPELFISGYSRECPVLPRLLTEPPPPDVFYIRYPSDSGYYYVAPEGYFIGLKKNRLKNKDAYPYLINCYKENHLLKRNSHLYQYCYGTDTLATHAESQKRHSLPHNIPIDGAYCRPVDVAPSDTDLIFIEVDSSNVASLVIPKHVHKYMWRRRHEHCSVIVQQYKGAYGMKQMVYSMVMLAGEHTFRYDAHPFLTALAARLEQHSGTDVVNGTEQYVDEHRKCVLVRLEDGQLQECYQEPLDIPLLELSDVSDLFGDAYDAYKLGIIDHTQYRNFTQRPHEIYEK